MRNMRNGFFVPQGFGEYFFGDFVDVDGKKKVNNKWINAFAK